MKLPTFIRHRLQVKFLLLLLAILTILTIAIIVVFVFYEIGNQRKSVLTQAKAFSSLSVRPIGNAYTTYFDSGSLKFKEITNNTLALDPDITRIEIIDVGGTVLYDSANTDQEGKKSGRSSIIEAAGNDKAVYFANLGQTNQIFEPFFDDFGAHPFSVLYFISYASVEKSVIAAIPLVIALTLLVGVLAALLVIFTVNRTLLEPIQEVVAGASRVSRGQLDSRILLNSGDELQTLAEAVNNMAASLQKNIEALKDLDRLKDEFIVIASHNLRTPITVLKGYLSEMHQKNLKKELEAPIERMITSVSQLEGLVEELVNIVSLEKNKTLSLEQKIDLVTIIKEVISFYSKQALEKEVSLQLVSARESYFIVGDTSKLKVVFSNLIENAIKFNNKGGEVTVKIDAVDGDVLTKIADSGIGISEDEMPLVFKKFHRATDVLQYNYQGLGLGLYLTKIIIEAHKGKIWFESKAGKGSTFFVNLPQFSAEGGES